MTLTDYRREGPVRASFGAQGMRGEIRLVDRGSDRGPAEGPTMFPVSVPRPARLPIRPSPPREAARAAPDPARRSSGPAAGPDRDRPPTGGAEPVGAWPSAAITLRSASRLRRGPERGRSGPTVPARSHPADHAAPAPPRPILALAAAINPP
jgi:hypothetical protein